MAMNLWIGIFLPVIGFLFISYAAHAVKHGVVRMGGRYSGGKKITRAEHPFAFWYEAGRYVLIGLFGLSPLLHPHGVRGWTHGISSLMFHVDKVLLFLAALSLSYAAWQIRTGVSYGRHYQKISRAELPKRFWLNVSRFLLFGAILAVLGSMGSERLAGMMQWEGGL
jgi:hypothetical protein